MNLTLLYPSLEFVECVRYNADCLDNNGKNITGSITAKFLKPTMLVHLWQDYFCLLSLYLWLGLTANLGLCSLNHAPQGFANRQHFKKVSDIYSLLSLCILT